jgi:hypothetical protein
LLEVDPANFRAKPACLRQELKKLSSLGKFEDYYRALFLGLEADSDLG